MKEEFEEGYIDQEKTPELCKMKKEFNLSEKRKEAFKEIQDYRSTTEHTMISVINTLLLIIEKQDKEFLKDIQDFCKENPTAEMISERIKLRAGKELIK